MSSTRREGSSIVINPPSPELIKQTLIMLVTRNVELRIESVTVSASRSAITVLMSKYVATTVTKSLIVIEREAVCSRI